MRIAIDAIALSHPQPGGFRTYVTNLVKHLAQVGDGHEFTLLVDRPIAWRPPGNWRVHVIPSGPSSLGVVTREQVALPRYLQHRPVDLLHMPCATGPLRSPVPTVVTLYDAIEFSEPLPRITRPKIWAMRAYSRLLQRRMALSAIRILTVSNYSKVQIANRLGLPSDKIVVVGGAPSAAYRQIDRTAATREVQRRHGATDFVLALASAAPRKNTKHLVEAYAMLARPLRARHPLILVCTHAATCHVLRRQAQSLGISDSLVLVSQPSDQELLLLYNAAFLFVFPSLDEGFGLPPLEAMCCGTPVIASKAGSLPEVLGSAAQWVCPTDRPGLTQAIAQVLTEPTLRTDLAQRGLERCRDFSWDLVARKTLEVYEASVDEK